MASAKCVYTGTPMYQCMTYICRHGANLDRNSLGEAFLMTWSVPLSVTMTVYSKQQTWTQQSLPQRCVYVGCQLISDQALRLLCLMGHVRAPGSTLWQHHWQEASEFLCAKNTSFGGIWVTKKITQKPRKYCLRRATNVVFSKFRGCVVKISRLGRTKFCPRKKRRYARFF